MQSLEQLQASLKRDFDRHDKRQQHEKRRHHRELRRQHHAIAEFALTNQSVGATRSVLLTKVVDACDDQDKEEDDHDQQTDHDKDDDKDRVRSDGESSAKEQDANANRMRRKARFRTRNKPMISSASASFYFPAHDSEQAQLEQLLQDFYSPTNATSDLICATCHSFRSAQYRSALPPPWEEYVSEASGKRYFFHPESQKVSWTPPSTTNPLSLYVFAHTNSVFTVCRCIPSHERRKKLLQKLKGFAFQAAQNETRERQKKLRTALQSLGVKPK